MNTSKCLKSNNIKKNGLLESVSKLFSIAISCQIKNYEGSDTNHRFAKLCAKFAEMFHSTPPPFLFTNTYTLRITVLTSTSKLYVCH